MVLNYGLNDVKIKGADTIIFCNYFPNGNNIKTTVKLEIYNQIKELL